MSTSYRLKVGAAPKNLRHLDPRMPQTNLEQKTAVVLVNTGSPAEPTREAVARYLGEFLGDRRVVEMHPLLWKPILHGIIIPRRAQASADRYKTVWGPDGSPLMAAAERTARALQAELGEAYSVAWAMCYGTHRVADVLERVVRDNPSKIVVVPLFPQYASQTTEAVFDALNRAVKSLRIASKITRIRDWHDNAAYIAALAQSVRKHWAAVGKIVGSKQKLMVSFHGIPQASSRRGDPYEGQCKKTAELLRVALELSPEQIEVVFQSKFGRAKWLEPAADVTAVQLGRGGLERLDVICPGFAADCLETLEEIATELKETYEAAGGRNFSYIAALNDTPPAVKLYAELVRGAI